MFCVRGFGGWLGFLLCGVVLVVRLVFWFSGSGLFVVLVPVVLLRGCAGVRGRVAGGSGFGGRCGAPGSSSCDGWGVGRAGPGFLVKWFRGGRVAPGSSSVLLGGGGLGVFFSARRSLFFWFWFRVLSGGPGSGGWGFWGVSGWVGVFSPASVVRPGPVPVLAWLRGLVLVVGCSVFVWRV